MGRVEWEISSEEEREERNETEKKTETEEREIQERKHTCGNLDQTGLIGNTGNVICLPNCSVESVVL